MLNLKIDGVPIVNMSNDLKIFLQVRYMHRPTCESICEPLIVLISGDHSRYGSCEVDNDGALISGRVVRGILAVRG